jgi:(E)-4-hydroxy-3-methylbut-2-enyl-diphosphate synthase
VKISVLGCVVNGPGEAREADIGIAAGNGQGMIFRNGEMVRRVPEAEIVDALMVELADWEKTNSHRIPSIKETEGLGRRKLPLVSV